MHDKGLLSAQTVLEQFDYDPDLETERKRYDTLQMAAMGGGMPGADGGMGGGFAGGDMGGGMGGAPGGEMGGEMGGEAPISAGGDMGGGGAPPAPATTASSIANPKDFGGKILKKKSREKVKSQQDKIYQQQEKHGVGGGDDGQSTQINFTGPEMKLMDQLREHQHNKLIKYQIFPQHSVKTASGTYPLDFAIPSLKIGN